MSLTPVHLFNQFSPLLHQFIIALDLKDDAVCSTTEPHSFKGFPIEMGICLFAVNADHRRVQKTGLRLAVFAIAF